jgi:transposase
MQQRDGRKLSHEVSEEIRRSAVLRVQEGEEPSVVIASYGLCRTSIYRWLRAAEEGGEEALASKKAKGPARRLTPKQEAQVRAWICGKDPRQHGFDFGLWTRQIVQDLIARRFKRRVSLSFVGRLLRRIGITPQKPLRRAYARDPEAIQAWLDFEYPKLRRRAGRRGASIFFLDEAGMRSDATLGRSWGAKGKTPEVPCFAGGTRQSVNAISAVNARGAFWYATYEGRLNGTQFRDFLRQFMRYRKKPVMLVVDGHPAHRAGLVSQYVKSLKGRLELHFLPPYAPDLNPDEFVWSHVRRTGLSKKPLRVGESLKARVVADLENIKRRPALVRSFFGAASVAYVVA